MIIWGGGEGGGGKEQKKKKPTFYGAKDAGIWFTHPSTK